MNLKSIIFFFFILYSSGILNAQVKIEFEKGKVIPNVVCLDDKDQNYALYLPKAYDPLKKWPIIIGFSPVARGSDPVTLCSEAAEKFGFIVIGSNNSKNGDSVPINKAYMALKTEIQKRFSVDPQRMYSIGMSGGSRVALRFASQEPDLFRGVIACAAFINPMDSFKDKNIFIYGIVGDEDFNFAEFKRGPLLEKTKTPYWIEIRKGIHQWPEKERVAEAIEMFDYLYQKNSEGKGLVQAEKIIKNRMTRIEEMINQKLWIHASTEVDNLIRNFESNSLIDKIKILRKKIDDSPEYVVVKKTETEFFELAEKIKQPEESPIYWSAFTKMQEFSKENNRLGNLAKGLLGSLSERIKASYKTINDDKTLPPAQKAIYFYIAHLAYPGDPRVPCVAAFFYAQAKDKAHTLTLLAETAKYGFNAPEEIQKEKEFEFLKDDPEFIKIIQKLTENKTIPTKK